MKNQLIKKLLFIGMITFGQPLWAGCESSILEGAHTAIKKQDAKTGAWEDAKEICYPGEATQLSVQCKKVKGDKGVQGKNATQCVQEISCNVCGDDLTRKYEARN